MTTGRPSDEGSRLGVWLRQARATAGLTQEELAERSGVGVRTIGDLERGRTRRPYARSIRCLAAALEVPFPGQPARPAVIPHQLPTPLRHFTGRRAELAWLTGLADQVGAAPGPVLITAIGGTAGVGKTALAVHWAHQVASRFPDGQLYVNLRGFDPSGRPVAAAEAIRGALDALGVPAGHIPSGLDSQASLYRTLLSGKRVLVLLDNARDTSQVRPLLPGSGGCLVLITSRSQLGGLVAAEGARTVALDLLTGAEARDLLEQRLGPARMAAEPTAVAELIELCARLPLALAIAAARVSARPGLTLGTLTGELSNAQRKLDALETEDAAASVRAVFSCSLQGMPAPAAQMFALLGVHPGPDITVAAAASLAGILPPQARRALRELAEANLVTEHAPGRFALHDLLRAYAIEQATATCDDAARDTVLARALDHYLHTARTAAMLLNPSREPITLAPPPPGVTPEPLASGQQALAWFEAEHRVLIGTVTTAARAGCDACAWQLAWALDDFLNWRGHWQEWAAIQSTAVTAATRLSDLAAQATARRLLAHTRARVGDYDQARAQLAQCLGLYRQLGDRTGEGRVHQTLGWVAERQNRYTDALGHAEQALALYQATGDQARQAAALNNIGWCHALLGNGQQARAYCQQALAMHRQLGHRPGEAGSWDSLGYAEYKLGNLAEAARCHRRGLDIARELGDRYAEAEFLTHLGDVHHTAGDPAAAKDAWQQALHILTDLHHPDAGQVQAKLAQLGEASRYARAAANARYHPPPFAT